jgi:Flp pilus assembly protein TadD
MVATVLTLGLAIGPSALHRGAKQSRSPDDMRVAVRTAQRDDGQQPANPLETASNRGLAAPADSGAPRAADAVAMRETPKAVSPAKSMSLKPAEALLSSGHIAEACERAEAILERGPTTSACLEFLGRCYMRLGQKERARSYYKRYLALTPEGPDAVFIRAMVELDEP